jgi:hypothetical protein
MPRGRVASKATVETLSKAFRSHFRGLEVSEFAGEMEHVVDACPEFIHEVLKLDYFPSEKVIRAAMSQAFPEVKKYGAVMAKQFKCVLNYMNTKRRSKHDGSRMHPMTANILDWLEKAQDSRPPMGHDCSSIVGNDNLAAPVSDGAAVDALLPLAAPVSDEDADDVLVSQVSINSSIQSDFARDYFDEQAQGSNVQEVGEQAQGSNVQEVSRPGKAKPAGYFQFWDHGRCTMVRSWPAASAGQPREELATMKLGEDGFLKACFGEDDPINTECANVLLNPKPKKKPAKATCKRPAAAVLKRPAKAKKGLAGQLMAVEEQLVCPGVELMAVEEQLALPGVEAVPFAAQESRFQFGDQTWIRVDCYTDQSYIRMQPLGEAKWPFLVACSSKQAARHGKVHSVIMKTVFRQLQLMSEVPGKDVCKGMVLLLLE